MTPLPTWPEFLQGARDRESRLDEELRAGVHGFLYVGPPMAPTSERDIRRMYENAVHARATAMFQTWVVCALDGNPAQADAALATSLLAGAV